MAEMDILSSKFQFILDETSPDRLELYAQRGNADVQLAVSANSRTPYLTLLRLTFSAHRRIRFNAVHTLLMAHKNRLNNEDLHRLAQVLDDEIMKDSYLNIRREIEEKGKQIELFKTEQK